MKLAYVPEVPPPPVVVPQNCKYMVRNGSLYTCYSEQEYQQYELEKQARVDADMRSARAFLDSNWLVILVCSCVVVIIYLVIKAKHGHRYY